VGYGKAGSFEGLCSGGGLKQLAEILRLEALQRGEAVPPAGAGSAKELAELARAGDPLALRVFETCGAYLGRGLAVIVDLLNPEVIVLGSVYHRAQRFLEPAMREVLAEEALPEALACCRVVPTALGEQIGDWAAVAIAVYHAGGFASAVRGAVEVALEPLAAQEH